MNRNLWTREEEIIVFNLYCKIPFQNSSKNNPEVIKIAKIIGRSSSAVNMKIGNFGSFDENLKKKGIVGLHADIENEDDLRIEMMYFETDISLSFSNANSDSRNCGGKIYFIEYDNSKNAKRNIFKDFLNIGIDPIYLICKDDDLGNILQQYKNKSIYVYIHDV